MDWSVCFAAILILWCLAAGYFCYYFCHFYWQKEDLIKELIKLEDRLEYHHSYDELIKKSEDQVYEHELEISEDEYVYEDARRDALLKIRKPGRIYK